MENWKTDIQDWTKLNKDLVNFYLSQAETHLKANIDLSDRITARATWLLSVIIPITVLTTGYLLSQTFLQYTNPYLTQIAAAGLCSLVICLGVLAWLSGKRRWMPPGGEPKEILTSNMVDNQLEGEQLYVAIVLGEVEAVQSKITATKAINQSRLEALKWIIIALVASFTVITIFVLRQLSFYI